MEVTTENRSQGKLFSWIERVGNKVPNPFLLFVYLIVVLMVATAIISGFDLAVKNPTNGELVRVNNLLSVAGIQWILPNIIKNFSGFTPLGSILALVIGAGLAEKTGLLQSLMVNMASRVSRRYASYMVLFIAFFSHISSDAALVVMPPLGALIFLAVGRHPVAGLLAAIAGVASGFTANLLIVTTDVLLSGISTGAAKTVSDTVHVSVIDNWFFMASSVIVLTTAGALLTDKFIEPRLSAWNGGNNDRLPPLRNPKTGGIIPSPFIHGIVPIIILFFFMVAIAYGAVTKQIRRADDIPQLLVDPMKSMAGFIVMVFPLSQFVAFFNWSNMGKFMAIGLTDILESAGINGAPAFLSLMFLSAFLCMFIASGSAIWSILAPVFVPMFMLLEFHPAFAQMIFRIADSAVLLLAPMSPFLPLFLGFLQRYQKNAQLGTYYVLIFPYPVVFFVSWIVLLLVWYALGLPIGLGVYPSLH
ncbi:AbgT family transporter [Salmonella enterica subsp. enterica]|nr:p-aminobenzoyl-glutamate transporter [Salmonella enterica subsp. enterica]